MPTISKHRISVDLSEDDHKYLKMCCAKLGMTIKQFVINETLKGVDAYEDKWMLERWARDGTNEELEKERSNPNRKVFEMVVENDQVTYKETTLAEVEKRSHGL